MSDVSGSVGVQGHSRALQIAVADYVAEHNGRVAFQGDDRVVVVTGRPVNHVVHLLLTIITGGLWIVVWILVAATRREESHLVTVDDAGQVLIQGHKTVNTGNLRLPRVVGLGLVVADLLLYPVGLRGPALAFGLLLLVVGGVALMVTDIRKHGTGRTVTVVERL
jgi:hypothetical protein